MASQIGDIARNIGWKGQQGYRIADPSAVTTMPVIDNTSPNMPNVRTSVDTYVHGQYIGKNGNIHEVRQRYTIFVSYSKDTQDQTMQQVRSAIASDFSSRYGKTFNMTTVFVPMLANAPGAADDIQFYRGSTTFKGRFDRAKWELGTEKVKYSTNVSNIKRRYTL